MFGKATDVMLDTTKVFEIMLKSDVCLSVYRCICIEKRHQLDAAIMVYYTCNLLNMFRSLTCPSSGARDYTCVIASGKREAARAASLIPDT